MATNLDRLARSLRTPAPSSGYGARRDRLVEDEDRGDTDSTGTASLTQTLSGQRASTVAEYMRAHGVDAGSIISIGFGNPRPLTEARDPDGCRRACFNRRVEMVLSVPR